MRNLIGKLRPSTSPMNSPVCAFFRPALVAMGSTSACPSSCVPSRTRIRYSFVSTRLGDLVSQFTWYFWPGKSRFTSLAVKLLNGVPGTHARVVAGGHGGGRGLQNSNGGRSVWLEGFASELGSVSGLS